MMKITRLFKHTIFLLFASLVLLTGCDSPEDVEDPNSIEGYEFPYEDLNDPKQWDMPRIQFYTDDMIWSMKLDGTNFRKVWDFNDLKEEDFGPTNHQVSRSPNNRYLAVSVLNRQGSMRLLVDLVTREYEILAEGSGPPSFTWSADSEHLIFIARMDLIKYNVKTKEITILSEKIGGRKLYLLKDQKTLLGVGSWFYAYYDMETGKELKKVELPRDVQSVRASDVSLDEDYLFYRYDYGSGVIDLRTGEEVFYSPFYDPVRKRELSINTGFFHDFGNTVVYEDYPRLMYLDALTGNIIEGPEFPPDKAILRASVINKSTSP